MRSNHILETSALLSKFTKSIFTALSEYKLQKVKENKKIIDLSIGSPDLPPPQFILNALAHHIQDVHQYGYTLTGTEKFHSAVANYYERRYNVTLKADVEVLQLMGSQDGIVHLPLALTNPNDIVLVPDPGYPAYEAGIHLAGAKPYYMPLKAENDFLPNVNQIPEEIAQRAKLMYVNFPGNPIPALPTEAFYKEIVQFAKKHDIVVVNDFAYSELIFTEGVPLSFLSVPGAVDVGVEFNSLSKSYNLAGTRIGYVVGNEHVIAALGKLKSNLDYGVFMPIQQAAIVALNEGDSFLAEQKDIYRRRRDAFIHGLNAIGWEIEKPEATMFIWAAIPNDLSSEQFTYTMVDQAGVVITPGSAFGEHGEGYVRIALVQSEEQLEQAVANIQRAQILTLAK